LGKLFRCRYVKDKEELKCCTWEYHAETENEILSKFIEQAQGKHYTTGMPPDVIKSVRENIYDEVKKQEGKKLKGVFPLGVLITWVWFVCIILFSIIASILINHFKYPPEMTILEWWYVSCILFIVATWIVFFLSPRFLLVGEIPSLLTFFHYHSDFRREVESSKDLSRLYFDKARTVALPLSITGVALTFLLIVVLEHLIVKKPNSFTTYHGVLGYFGVLFSFASLAFTFFALEFLDTVANPFKGEWDHEDKVNKRFQRFFYRRAVLFGGIGLAYLAYAALSVAGAIIASVLFYKHLAFFACLASVSIGLPYLFGYYKFDEKNEVTVHKIKIRKEDEDGKSKTEISERLRPRFRRLMIFYFVLIVLIQIILCLPYLFPDKTEFHFLLIKFQFLSFESIFNLQ